VRCGVSGKRRNDADGRIWPTEGRFFAPAGRRYASLVVNQTTAQSMPGRQARKTGQMDQNLLPLVLLTGVAMAYMPKRFDEDIRLKMLELASELRYLAADGILNKPKFAVSVAVLLEESAQAECSDTGIAFKRTRQSAIGNIRSESR